MACKRVAERIDVQCGQLYLRLARLIRSWPHIDDVLVRGSPLALTVRPGVSARSSNITGDGTMEAHVGQPAEVVLRLMMHSNIPGVCSSPASRELLRDANSPGACD